MKNFGLLLAILCFCPNVYGQSIADLTKMAEEKKRFSAFDYVGEFYEGLAIAKQQSEDGVNVYTGVINEMGNIYVPFVYDDISLELLCSNYFGNYNIYKCRKNGKYGFVSSEGYEILPCKYSSLVKIKGTKLWYAAVKDGKYGYVVLSVNADKANEIIPCIYDKLQISSTGLIHATYKGMKGILNKDNKIIVPIEFSYISDSYNNMVWVEKDGKVGLYNLQGEQLQSCDIEKVFVYADNRQCAVSYKDKPMFSEDCIYIVRNGMTGVMNRHCNTIIPCEYQHITPFVKNKAFYKKYDR